MREEETNLIQKAAMSCVLQQDRLKTLMPSVSVLGEVGRETSAGSCMTNAARADEFWDALWRREREFMESGEKELRHGTSFVAVSTIAGQFYCEYKVENEFAFGEVPTEAKDQGTDLHDELIPFEPITEKQFAELVGRKEPSYAVLHVWGTVGGLRLVGTPDHIVWSEGRPLWLVELKTTRGDPASLWPDQMNQTLIYGLLLELMGFDCSRLKLALVRLRAGELTDEDRQLWMERVSTHLQAGTLAELEAEYRSAMKVHLLAHDRATAEASAMEKQGYWLGQREATSSESPGKCRACEYSSVCPKSLFRPP
ncbi:MAG: PD-(D/E)XK nuclease family protein [Thaumarchaeota archaeon]|nr:PD-(D/E)XK nuclease family protein [Nitrososphaerota archaeon]